jgi:toxin ParE1/3/4
VTLAVIHPAAEREADLAFEWYWNESPRAAIHFSDQLLEAYFAIGQNPLSYPYYLYGTRRKILDRYPFFVVFHQHRNKIEIVAVAHAKRRPGYWSKRL